MAFKTHIERLCWRAVNSYYGMPWQDNYNHEGRSVRYKRLIKTVKPVEKDGYLWIEYEGKEYSIKREWPQHPYSGSKQDNIIAFPGQATQTTQEYDEDDYHAECELNDSDECYINVQPMLREVVEEEKRISEYEPILKFAKPVFSLKVEGIPPVPDIVYKLGNSYYHRDPWGEDTIWDVESVFGPYYSLKQFLILTDRNTLYPYNKFIYFCDPEEMKTEQLAALLKPGEELEPNYQVQINNELWEWTEPGGLRKI